MSSILLRAAITADELAELRILAIRRGVLNQEQNAEAIRMLLAKYRKGEGK